MRRRRFYSQSLSVLLLTSEHENVFCEIASTLEVHSFEKKERNQIVDDRNKILCVDVCVYVTELKKNIT